MVTYCCRQCWAEVKPRDTKCWRCGAPLGEDSDEDFVGDLLAALRHPAPANRRHAAWILGQLRERRAVGPLAEAMRGTRDADLLEGAAEALGKIGDEAGVEPLVGLLHGGFLGARVRAVEALGGIGGPKAIAALREALRNPSAVVRETATRLLRAIGEGSDTDHRRGPAA